MASRHQTGSAVSAQAEQYDPDMPDDLDQPRELPPHDLAAEEAVLGSIIIDGSRHEYVRAIINDGHFYREMNAEVFAAIERVYLGGGRIDQLTIASELATSTVNFADMPAAAYLSHVVSITPTSVHATDYAKLIRSAWAARQAITLGREIIASAFSNPGERTLADALMSAGLKVGGSGSASRRLLSMADIFDRGQVEILDTFIHSKGDRGLSTGMRAFDEAIGGLHRGQLGIIASRANMGKSFMATQIANGVAGHKRKDLDLIELSENNRVAVFSLEMSNEEVFRRITSSDLGIDFEDIEQSERDELHSDVYEALIETAEKSIFISDTPRLSVDEIRAQAMMLQARQGIDLLMIDYLQLIQPPLLGRGATQVQLLEWITRELKMLARELDVPVVVMCQLNRQTEQRGSMKGGSYRPRLDDLRGSGSIEQDADWVVLLYRHDYYVERGTVTPDDVQADKLEFIVGKLRDGGITPGLAVYFNPRRSRLEDISEDNDRPGR